MRQPIYTSIYGLATIVLFFILGITYQSCGKKKDEALTIDQMSENVEEIADKYSDESIFEDDEYSDDSDASDGEVQDDSYTTSGSDQESDATYTYQQEEAQTTNSSSLSSGYMVIAGNYLLEDNAKSMVNKLQQAGYSNARKVVFDLSQYYTVIAGIYDDRSVASSVSSELNGKSIDNYVLKRKN
jgi:Sporulation related domain.